MSKLLEEILERKRKRLTAEYLIERKLCQKWIANCQNLMSRITEWLEHLEDANYLEIELENIPIWEDQFGEYEVPALRLVFLKRQILSIKPIGYFVIGSRGRVDITAGITSLAMLIHRGDDEWEFAKRMGRYGKLRTWAFNQDTFEEFLIAFLEEE